MKIHPVEKVSVASIRGNEKNPRYIRDKEFKELIKSIKDFPKMMEARPIIVDEEGIILGGNMRYKAALELGYTDVHIVRVTDATEDQKREFIIKDNVSKGEWDWDMLANEWNTVELTEWGLILPTEQKWDELDFIPEAEKPNFDKDTTIVITIPKELKDEKRKIEDAVKELLSDKFSGCEIK